MFTFRVIVWVVAIEMNEQPNDNKMANEKKKGEEKRRRKTTVIHGNGAELMGSHNK